MVCEFCQGNHRSEDCKVGNPFMQSNIEQAQFVGNFNEQQNNPYSNTYNLEWCNHPNLSWRNSPNVTQPPLASSLKRKITVLKKQCHNWLTIKISS